METLITLFLEVVMLTQVNVLSVVTTAMDSIVNTANLDIMEMPLVKTVKVSISGFPTFWII